MVQGDGNPDDRREQLGQGKTSDCLSTRRRWQKSSTKVSNVSIANKYKSNHVAR